LKTNIINYIRAGYPGLYLVSPEGQRVDAEIKQIAQDLKYSLHVWSVVDGLLDTVSRAYPPLTLQDPTANIVDVYWP